MGRKSSKSRKPAGFCFHLPLDLIAEVLARLPVKTLLKFRCVCKEWRSLIDSPDFASLHFTLYNSNRQNARLFLIEEGSHKRQCSIRRSDTFRKTCEVVLPKDCGNLWPVGYVNGLVLCSRYRSNDLQVLGFIMWNPSIRKSMEIPPPSDSLDLNGIQVVLLDPPGAEDDYKLVVIPFDHPSWNQRSSRQRIPSTVLIEVYSFSTGSWRSSSIDTQCVKDLAYKTTVSLNGAVHWTGRNALNDSHIVAFDVQNDVFRYFRLPAARDIQFGTLSILHESLVILLKSKQGCYHLWVMEHYGMAESWVNRFKFVMGYGRALSFKRNGKLFFTKGNKGLKVYAIETGEMKDLAKSYNHDIVFMDTVVETLVLLPRGDKEPKKSSV